MPISRRFAASSLFAMGPILVLAQLPDRRFSIGQVMSAPFASSLCSSAKGDAVAWLLNDQGQRNVWAANAPDWKGRRLTRFDNDDGQEIDELQWSPDGMYILFARGGDFENGHENPNPALSPQPPEQAIWYASVDGSRVKRLTEGHAPAISPKGDIVAFLRAGQIFTMSATGENVKSLLTQQGSVHQLRWSPDGTRLAFRDDRPGHGFIGVYTFANQGIRYLHPSVDNDESPVWSPDGSQIAYLRIAAITRPFVFGPEREGEPWSILISRVDDGSTRQAFRATPGSGSVFSRVVAEQQLWWTADNRVVFPWEQTGWRHLYSIATAGGAPVELTPGEGEIEHVTLSHDGNAIFYSANFNDLDRRHLWSVSASGTGRPKALTRGENIEWGPAPLADGSSLAFLASTYNEKSHAALLQNGVPKALALEATPREFPSALMIKPEPVIITAADGLQIHGQIFAPENRDSGRHPALIFFHGGSRRQMLLGFHSMYYYSNAYSFNEYLANQGYLVLSVNYRSGTGYGLDFREALHYGATGASELNDVIGAGLYLKSRPDVDATRIGVWGGSYGGYLTAMALAHASDLFAAGVDFQGVHDWNLEIQNFIPAYRPEERQDAARLAFESSPLASIDKWKSPVLLIHGDDDRNVPFAETIELTEALRKQHVFFEEMIIPNEVHDFLLHRHWVEAYSAAADFFRRKLGMGENAGTR